MQLRPYQIECINSIPESGRYLIQMPTGAGKCFAKGTKIKMFDGSVKNIEDIKENELVMGEDSTPRKVKGLARGVEMMYKVTPVKGNPYVVNESHILSLKITGMGNTRKKIVTDCIGKKYSSGDICNISVKDYMACSKTFKHVAKGWRAPVEYPQKKVDIPPYILGVWLGDGTSSGPQITTMEPEIIREFARYCTSNGLALSATASSQTGKAITYGIIARKQSWGGNIFRNQLRLRGLINNKHIPKDYLINSRKNRLELLAGLLDTDGYLIDGCCFEIASVSKVLSVQILELARSLGFAAYSSIKVVNGDKYYRINISGDTHLIPTRVERRKAHKRKQIKDVLLTGIKVESIGIGEYYGFEIEGDKKLFLLEDFTVVHNTVTFANIPRRGKTLILAHREELIYQPIKYYDCPVGIEMADRTSNGEEVIIASVQSLVRRIDKFPTDYFDMIIIDEAHHAGALTYKKICNYFNPRLLLGFTATPNRGDKVRLDDVFERIIFQRDIKWAIKNKYLCDIHCLRVNIGYDLSKVSKRMGDFAPGELEAAMNIEAQNKAIAEAYYKHAKGQTLIFATSVKHAEAIAKEIKGAVAVTADTKNRADIIDRFTRREIPVLVNCMIFTEGTDMPLVETVIMARPTQSDTLYTQAVGRGLRLYPGKDKLILIDCVGVSGKASLCAAPTLIGLDISEVPERYQDDIEGDLFDLPELILQKSDTPESWIRNIELVNLWAKQQKYNTHNINFFKLPNGDLLVNLPNKVKYKIAAQDELGLSEGIPMQQAIDNLYKVLSENHQDSKYVWDLTVAKRWGKKPASEKQIKLIKRRLKKYDADGLTKLEASQILNRVMCNA